MTFLDRHTQITAEMLGKSGGPAQKRKLGAVEGCKLRKNL